MLVGRLLFGVHCEELGGTGSAFLKGYNNDTRHINCYSFATYYSNKSILKASRELQAPFLSQLGKL